MSETKIASMSTSTTPQGVLSWELLKLYVDLSKHHFDLLLKGSAVYLAIIATAAGFVFRTETEPVTRTALLLLVAIVSIAAVIAWSLLSFGHVHSACKWRTSVLNSESP